jgi:large subunit ribosomal protein L5
MNNRLKTRYETELKPALAKQFGIKNTMAVPKLLKVVVNVGVGKTLKDPKLLEAIVEDIRTITGQSPVKTISRKAIAGFKIREGQIVGVMVTLRGQRMYDFVDKLVNSALPRVRDFRGISPNAFDGRGNYHVGLREQLMFPEIGEESLEHTFGMEISIVTNAGTDEKGRALLQSMGFPFAKVEK